MPRWHRDGPDAALRRDMGTGSLVPGQDHLDFTDTDYSCSSERPAPKVASSTRITFALYGTCTAGTTAVITPRSRRTRPAGVVGSSSTQTGNATPSPRARRSVGKTHACPCNASRRSACTILWTSTVTSTRSPSESDVTESRREPPRPQTTLHDVALTLIKGQSMNPAQPSPATGKDILSSLLGYQALRELESRANSRAGKSAPHATREACPRGYAEATEQQGQRPHRSRRTDSTSYRPGSSAPRHTQPQAGRASRTIPATVSTNWPRNSRRWPRPASRPA